MHPRRSSCLIAFALATVLPGADVAPTVTILPTSLEVRCTSERIDGTWTSVRSDLGLSATVAVEGPHPILGIGPLHLTGLRSAIPDLAIRTPNATIWGGVRWSAPPQDRPTDTGLQARTSLVMTAPAGPGGRIDALSGSLQVTMASGTPRTVAIPVGSAPATIDGATFDLHGRDGELPIILLGPALGRRVLQITLSTTAEGPTPGLRGHRQDDAGWYLYLVRPLGAKDTVHLTLAEQAVTYEVPFSVGPVDLAVLDP